MTVTRMFNKMTRELRNNSLTS